MLKIFPELDIQPPELFRVRNHYKNIKDEMYRKLDHASILLADGYCEFQTEDFQSAVNPGDIIVLPQNRTRHFIKPKMLNLRFCHFYPPVDHSLEKGFLFPAGESFLRLCKICDRIITASGVGAKNRKALLWNFLFDVDTVYENWKNPRNPLDSRIEKAIMLIHSHRSQDFRVQSLADEVGISHNHLTRLFKKATGMSVIGYIQKVRMDLAKELLIETETPIKEIAFHCGYNNLQHFNKAVHSYFNCSPRILSERFRGEIKIKK